MNLILQGKPKKSIIVYSQKPRKVGEEVRVFDNGQLVQTGKIVRDMSTVKKIPGCQKRIGDKDVLFNAGKGYYQIELKG